MMGLRTGLRMDIHTGVRTGISTRLGSSGRALLAAATVAGALALAGCGSTVKLDETPVETRTPNAVAKSLTLLGATEAQVEAVSFGKERPADEGHDEAAWAKNRRAELKDR